MGENYGYKTIGEIADYVKLHKSIFNVGEEKEEMKELKMEVRKYGFKPEDKLTYCLNTIQERRNSV